MGGFAHIPLLSFLPLSPFPLGSLGILYQVVKRNYIPVAALHFILSHITSSGHSIKVSLLITSGGLGGKLVLP